MEARKLLKSTLAVALLTTGSAFAAITSGQLVIVNSLGNTVPATGSSGATASPMKVVVSDATGVCSTTASLAYNGTAVIKWDANKSHSASQCTDIASVDVTPLKTTVGSLSTMVYDSVANTAIPVLTPTAAVTFTAPSTVYSNLALVVNGTGVPASAVTVSATAWGVGAALAPVFNAGNGALATTGVPGAVGAYGLKAEKLMRQHAVLPFHAETN